MKENKEKHIAIFHKREGYSEVSEKIGQLKVKLEVGHE